MNIRRTLCLTLLLFAVIAISAPTAKAQTPINLSGQLAIQNSLSGGFVAQQVYGGQSYHEFARVLPRPFRGAVLPYFALYPPVYYSHVVPRAYGYSPFALRPGKAPAEAAVAVDKSEEVINPYYKPNENQVNATPKLDESVSNSKMIINPFVEQNTIERLVTRIDVQESR